MAGVHGAGEALLEHLYEAFTGKKWVDRGRLCWLLLASGLLREGVGGGGGSALMAGPALVGGEVKTAWGG